MKKSKKFWVLTGIIYALFIAPNAMIIKSATETTDPYYWNFIRFLVVLIATAPFMILSWRSLVNKKAVGWVLGAAALMTTAVLTYTVAIQLSLASYVSIITLVNPIFLVLISPFFTKEHVSKRAFFGVTLAALGSMVIVIMPIAVYQHGFVFYPIATFLGIVNAFCFVLAVIMLRRANENGASLTGSIGVNALLSTIVSLLLFLWAGNHQLAPSPYSFLLSAVYSGIGVCLVARAVSVKIFENTSAAFMGALTYLDTFVSILLPILILGETLSLPTILGGLLILAGVYVVESHKSLHAKHHYIWRHH